jgi:hypothetical protein
MKDYFADSPGGRVALAKIKPASPNFRLYAAGWIEKGPPANWNTMEFTGAEFRAAKTGPNKGKLTVEIPGTRCSAYVTKDEMRKAEKKRKKQDLAPAESRGSRHV